MFGSIGMPELIVILVITMIVFGHDKLPEVGSIIGKAIMVFKKAISEPEGKSGELPERKNIDDEKE